MIKTQIQLPDRLYHEAKRVAEERELSLAEVVRRGVEYVVSVFPPIGQTAASAPWKPPPARHLGAFRAPAEQWREIAAEADTTVPQEPRS